MIAAPVCLFVYNRVDHVERTVAALAANTLATETDLTVFADGAKGEADAASVAAVRSFVAGIEGFNSVTVVERPRNMGLSVSLIAGTTEMLEANERVIVVEDDLVTSPHFLTFMNDGLETYANDPKVASIHGYNYPIDTAGLDDTFFLRTGDCWGWATWRRAWAVFEPNGSQLLSEIRRLDLKSTFDLDDSYPYTQLLRHQTKGLTQSWAVRWSASVLLADMLTLYPTESLVVNIGNDGSGTHGQSEAIPGSNMDRFGSELRMTPVPVGTIAVKEDPAARRAVATYLAATQPSRLRTFCGPYIKKALRYLPRGVPGSRR